jgi:hypothetical protein
MARQNIMAKAHDRAKLLMSWRVRERKMMGPGFCHPLLRHTLRT